jgi:hypothetical protein
MSGTKEEQIISILKEKSKIKQKVFSNTYEVFASLKGILKEMEVSYNSQLQGHFSDKSLQYNEVSTFQHELKVAGDMLVFQMHSNIFEFDRDHGVWQISYIQNDKMATYCGIINIYNFLNDSFKYNRVNDLGYLVGRIFINKDFHYFVEGKRQMGFLYNDFGNDVINKESLKTIIETAVSYSLEFDLLVPPYENVKIITVDQIQEKRKNSQQITGKRLGFGFRSDDVGVENVIYTGA